MASQDFSLWYSAKAKLFWREAEKYYESFKYPESMAVYGDSIEFAAKAICEIKNHPYKLEHGMGNPLMELAAKFPEYKLPFSRLAWISSRWVGMRQTARNVVRYGNQVAKLPATQIIGKNDVQPIKTDALEACQILCTLEIEKKFKPPITIGILNGYVDASNELEKPCTATPYMEFSIDDLEKKFYSLQVHMENKYSIERIAVSEVGNDYAMILNPFGEAYPENDVKNRFAFNILKNYVADGGILVNTAGFPFFYAWDVIKGREEPVTDEKTLLPQQIRIEEGKPVVDEFITLLNFAGSLLWREIGAITTVDTRKFSGIKELDVYQNDSDKEIVGDLSKVIVDNKIYEYRALRKKSKNLIPLLRANRPDFNEVYPLAAVSHGWGYFILAGMYTKSENELRTIVHALDNFCNWMKDKKCNV